VRRAPGLPRPAVRYAAGNVGLTTTDANTSWNASSSTTGATPNSRLGTDFR
jgi:hypothetical protein